MGYFDPDTYAVCAEPAFTRISLPGMTYAPFGTVRDVDVFNNRDDVIRCVCFTFNEVSAAAGATEYGLQLFSEANHLPVAIYPALTLLSSGVRARYRWRPVFLYPEAKVIADLWRAIQSRAVRVTLDDRKLWVARAIDKIRTIRAEVGETIE